MKTRIDDEDDDDSSLPPLEDKTAALPSHSKRASRLAKRATRLRHAHHPATTEPPTLLSLPTELLCQILSYLRPSTLLDVSSTCHHLHAVVSSNLEPIAREILRNRYPILSRCLPLPTLLSTHPPTTQSALRMPRRHIAHPTVTGRTTSYMNVQYNHIAKLDPHLLCSCLTCVHSWNNLAVALDFAHFASDLDNGRPLPVGPRHLMPASILDLEAKFAALITSALHSPFRYASILERHLESCVRAIRRHEKNAGNRRERYSVSQEEEDSGTDEWLEKQGPPSLEFPYNRDEYYLLEAYVPCRWWRKEKGWIYYAEGGCERDTKMVLEWFRRVKEEEEEMEEERRRTARPG